MGATFRQNDGKHPPDPIAIVAKSALRGRSKTIQSVGDDVDRPANSVAQPGKND